MEQSIAKFKWNHNYSRRCICNGLIQSVGVFLQTYMFPYNNKIKPNQYVCVKQWNIITLSYLNFVAVIVTAVEVI